MTAKKILKPFYHASLPVLRLIPIGLVQGLNRGLRALTAQSHRLQQMLQWRIAKHPPEWYDHFCDQHWRWALTRNPMSWERGIIGLMGMRPGARVLDLCCGGGFFANRFFSTRASQVTSVDFDPNAISHAKKNFHAPNVEYVCADIRTGMPNGTFDNVAWDAAIEHFTEVEMAQIITNIKNRLTPEGVLNGYTIIERPGFKGHEDHEHEFASREELAVLLKKYFKNVLILSTGYQDQFEQRDNLYFFASDGAVPFDPSWPSALRV
jgi:2-polyprenyl-3-methyl-5-hydroxy-6-metoxy-1,4-benzoquinol methylase